MNDGAPLGAMTDAPLVVPVRVALYVRVSTEEQRVEEQEAELRAEASRRGWIVFEPVYCEQESATGKVARKQYDQLLRDLHKPNRSWSRLLVWSLDRFSRAERFTQAIEAVWTLERGGVRFHSLKEPMLDSTEDGEPSFVQELLLSLLPVLSAWESRRKADRVRLAMRAIKAGTRRTRSGLAPGRQRRVFQEQVDLIVALRSEDPPVVFAKVAQRTGLPASTCRRVHSEWRRGLWSLTTPHARKGAPPLANVPAPLGPLGSRVAKGEVSL